MTFDKLFIHHNFTDIASKIQIGRKIGKRSSKIEREIFTVKFGDFGLNSRPVFLGDKILNF